MASPTAKGKVEFVPVDQLRDMLEAIGDSALDGIEEQGMMRLMLVLETKAVQLAPVDTGNLEASTHVTVHGGGGIVKGVLRFNAPYAARVHELPEESRGPKTRAKPGNEFGPAGPKYLERPLRGFKKELRKGLTEFLKKAWSKPRRGGRK